MEKTTSNRNLALLGVLGGLVLAMAVCLSLCFEGFSISASGIAAWGRLPVWRVALSAGLGVLGHLFLLCGLWSGYRIIRTHCHHIRRGLYLFGIGARSTGVLLHFLLFCFGPLLIRAMGGMASAAAVKSVTEILLAVGPAAGVCLVLQIFAVIAVTAALLSGDVHVSRSLALMNILTVGLVPAGLFILMKDLDYRGVLIAAAYLGDSLQMFSILGYWRRKGRPDISDGEE
ncbi:MAG: hypothetical protein IKI84_04325 [Clostridia bacterium]|nr:hypothetical protein [Clostridia bacterium]